MICVSEIVLGCIFGLCAPCIVGECPLGRIMHDRTKRRGDIAGPLRLTRVTNETRTELITINKRSFKVSKSSRIYLMRFAIEQTTLITKVGTCGYRESNNRGTGEGVGGGGGGATETRCD